MEQREKTEFIRKACIEANPETEWCNCCRRIQLADVLVAFEVRKPTVRVTDTDSVDYGKSFDATLLWQQIILHYWNLKLPLEKQSEETINRIYQLLKT